MLLLLMIQKETKKLLKSNPFEGDLLILESPEITVHVIVTYTAMQQT